MRQNLYTQIWMDNLSRIIEVMKDGGGELQLKKQDFEAAGNRDLYGFRLEIKNAVIPRHRGSAVARDLKEVLDYSKEFYNFAREKNWVIRMGKDFILEVFESVM